MLARVGRYDELKAFLAGLGERKFIGQATELMMAGKEGIASMEQRPDISFRCGPLALSRILASQRSPLASSPEILNSKSTMQGISLADVATLSAKLGMNYQPAKRAAGAALILPSVIHWRVGHYAALVKQVGDRYLSQDPTFENETWHTLAALEAEASGYFLVPPGPLPAGWTSVDDAEAKGVFGKGVTTGSNGNGTGNGDGSDGGCPPGCCRPAPGAGSPPGSPGPDTGSPSGGGGGGAPDNRTPNDGMAGYSFHLMLASLKITDTPVGYRPPYGYPVNFMVTYAQREASQPSNFNYSNLGPKWNFNWLTCLIDDPANPATGSQATPGGGTVAYSYSGISGGNYVFDTQFDTGQQLSRPTSGLPYTSVNTDGSKQIFGQSDGSSTAPRRVFLTQYIDPSGNATTLTYDGLLRITAITDALGQQTTLAYELAGDVYKITKVTDPFGRFAQFFYDGSGRLIKIRDVIGLESVFTYDGTTDFITSLTTPYGTTTFTSSTNGMDRWLTATDPDGDTEVVETNNLQTAGISGGEALAPDPARMGVTGLYNANLYYRNSFHWNKKQWKEYPGDITKAHIYHWLHDQNGVQMGRYLESEKMPLESRVWYAYPGQTGYSGEGTGTVPRAIARVTEGGDQVTLQNLNVLNLPTSITDPAGRTTTFQYAANNIDVLSMSQVIHGPPISSVTLATFTYNTQHLPLTITDAAGQVTTNTYNANGQITSVTNAKNEIATFTYYSADVAGKQRRGRMQQIDGPLPGSTDVTTFDYDAFGRVASVTGPDGYFLTYTYDPMDRLTRITFPDGTYTETTFQALDPATARDRLGRITSFSYNSIRQLVSMTDPANRTFRYAWCACGALKQLIDPLGRITTWKHDVASRVTSKVYTDGSTMTNSYEPLSGRLLTTTDEKAQVKTRAYNLDNSLASLTYSNATIATSSVAYAYDPDFTRVTSMTDGTGVTNFTFNAIAPGTYGAGQVAGVDGPLTNDTITVTYDQLGRVTARAIDGTGESYVFDAAGRVTSVVNPLGTFGFGYVGNTGRVSLLTFPNGMTSAYGYQSLTGDFRLQSIAHTLPGSVAVGQHTYGYDAQGHITSWAVQDGAAAAVSYTASYDAADRLASFTSAADNYSYTYDAADNRLTETIGGATTTASHNALNEVTAISATTTPPTRAYSWDAENRLVAVDYTGSSLRTEFTYDGLNRCVRIVEKNGATITADRRFVWCGYARAEERDAAGTSVVRRFYADGEQIGGQSFYYCLDHLGSVRQVTDASTVRARYAYDPWGRRSKLAGDVDAMAGFTGHFTHAPSGMSLAPFRAYDPALGRWLNRDPIKERSGVNMLAYVANSPIDMLDPLGLEGAMLEGHTGYSPAPKPNYGTYEDNHGNMRFVDSHGRDRELTELSPKDPGFKMGLRYYTPRLEDERTQFAQCQTHALDAKMHGQKIKMTPTHGAVILPQKDVDGQTLYEQINGNANLESNDSFSRENLFISNREYMVRSGFFK
jgi:RHS repeat-associated protein